MPSTDSPSARSQAPLVVARSTDPPVVAVSTASKTKSAVVNLTFSRGVEPLPVKCREITVTIPVGTGAGDLTSNPGVIDPDYGTSAGTWVITQTDHDTFTTFSCTKSGPVKTFVFEQGTWFTLILKSVAVSRTPGDVSLTVTADTTTAESPEDDDWSEEPITMSEFAKSTENFFFFNSFSCVEPRVVNGANGGTVTLCWEGSETDTEYYLSWDDRAPVKVTGKSHQVGGLTDTTTFVLDARTPDPTAADGFTHHRLSTTVTVKDPDIAAKTLTASSRIAVTDTFSADSGSRTTTALGPTTFEGDVTIMAKLTANGPIDAKGLITANDGVTVATGKTLTANGPIDAKDAVTVAAGKTLTANGPLKALSTAEVTGNVTIQGELDAKGVARLHKTLNVTEKTTVPQLDVKGDTVFSANVDFAGSTSLVGTRQTLSVPYNTPRTFTAGTAGIVVGVLRSGYYKQMSEAVISSGGTNVYITAHQTWDYTSDWQTGILPVAKGATFSITLRNVLDHNPTYESGSFTFIPLGRGTAALAALSELAPDDEPAVAVGGDS